jgi:succinate dehydrogenase hydrophobic anchor subunit
MVLAFLRHGKHNWLMNNASTVIALLIALVALACQIFATVVRNRRFQRIARRLRDAEYAYPAARFARLRAELGSVEMGGRA